MGTRIRFVPGAVFSCASVFDLMASFATFVPGRKASVPVLLLALYVMLQTAAAISDSGKKYPMFSAECGGSGVYHGDTRKVDGMLERCKECYGPKAQLFYSSWFADGLGATDCAVPHDADDEF